LEILDREPPTASWGLVSSDGTPILAAAYPRILAPGAGQRVAAAQLEGGGYALVDIDDGTVLADGFDAFGRTSDGLAPMRRDGKWGVVRYDGTWLIANDFVHASEITESRVFMKTEQGWRCYDVTTGEPVGTQHFDSYTDFFE